MVISLVSRGTSGAARRMQDRHQLDILALANVDEAAGRRVCAAMPFDDVGTRGFMDAELFKRREFIDEGHRFQQEAAMAIR